MSTVRIMQLYRHSNIVLAMPFRFFLQICQLPFVNIQVLNVCVDSAMRPDLIQLPYAQSVAHGCPLTEVHLTCLTPVPPFWSSVVWSSDAGIIESWCLLFGLQFLVILNCPSNQGQELYRNHCHVTDRQICLCERPDKFMSVDSKQTTWTCQMILKNQQST